MVVLDDYLINHILHNPNADLPNVNVQTIRFILQLEQRARNASNLISIRPQYHHMLNCRTLFAQIRKHNPIWKLDYYNDINFLVYHKYDQ